MRAGRGERQEWVDIVDIVDTVDLVDNVDPRPGRVAPSSRGTGDTGALKAFRWPALSMM